MGRIIETTIDRFDGGITNDPRDQAQNVARMVTNFDVITTPKKMTPYRSSESGDSAASTNKRQSFAVALRTGTTYSLFALGVQASNKAGVMYKNLTISSTNDFSDDGWVDPTNGKSAGGATDFKLFVYYKKTGLIYGAEAGTTIWTFDPSDGAAFSSASHALNYSHIAQGIVHSQDDILYIPYSDTATNPLPKIAVNNNGSWTDAALTLSAGYLITSICEYGNFLAIALAPVTGVGNSRVVLWNRDTSLTTISENIDWGSGSLMILEEVDGVLIGISQKGGTATSVTGNPNGTVGFKDRVVVRALVGNKAQKLDEYIGGFDANRNTLQVPIAKQKVDNRLYFTMIIYYNGAVRDGVWSYGRSSPNSPFALVHERTTNNDTALLTSDSIKGFIVVGDFIFISYTTGGTYALTKTNETNPGLYSHNSIYESKRYNGGDSSLKKDLLGITVMFEYLPSGASVTVKYRVDQNTSFTTLLTSSTANSISGSAVSAQSSPNTFPKEYKEIEFQLISTGGAEITGFSFQEEITGKRLYEDYKK